MNIKFDDVTVLIGQNNSGKTTILEGLETTLTSKKIFKSNYITKTATSTESLVKVSIKLNENDLREVLDNRGIQWKIEHDKILQQKITFEWKHTFKEDLKNCSLDNNFQSRYNTELQLDSILTELKNTIGQYVLYLGPDSFCKTLEENYLSDSIKQLRRQGSFIRLNTDLKKIFNNYEIVFSDNDNKPIIIQKFSNKEIDLDLIELGDGFKRILFMIINVLLHRPKIILLDEPDISVHSGLIKNIILYLKEINVQVIVATHNEIFLNEFKKKNIRFLRSKSAIASTIVKDEYFSIDDVFNDLGLNIRYKKSRILSSDLVILVEDESDEEYITKMFKLIRNNILTKFSIAFEYTGGNKLIDFSIFDKINQSPIPIMIVRDSDERSDQQVSDLNNKYGDRIHLWKRREIENYALSINSLNRVTRSKNTKRKAAKLVDLENQIKAASRKLINKVVIMSIYAKYKKSYLLNEQREIHNFLQRYKDKSIEKISDKFRSEIIDKFTRRFDNLQNEFKIERERLLKSWRNLNNIFNDCPGKDLITEIRCITKSEFSEMTLFDSISQRDIDDDVKVFADKINRIVTHERYRYLYAIQLYRSRRGIENIRNVNFLNNENLSPVVIIDSMGYVSNFRPTSDKKEIVRDRYSYHDIVNKRYICKYFIESGNCANLIDFGTNVYIRDIIHCRHKKLELLLATGSYHVKKDDQRYPDSFDSLFVIDLASGKMIRKIDLFYGGDDDGKEGDLGSLLYNSNNQTIYVSSIYAEGGNPCLYTIPLRLVLDVDVTEKELLENVNSIKIGHHGPISIAIDEEINSLYAIDNDQYVYAIDLKTNSVRDRIPIKEGSDRIFPEDRKQIAVDVKYNHNLYVIIKGRLLYLDMNKRKVTKTKSNEEFLFVVSDIVSKNTFAVVRENDEDSDKPYSDVLCILENNLVAIRVAKFSSDIHVVDISCNSNIICVIAKHNEIENESSMWFFRMT